jgi:hypothetical protein
VRRYEFLCVKGSLVKVLSLLLILSSLSAYATDVPVANLIVTVHKDCNSQSFSALSMDPADSSDYQAEILSVKPLQCDTDAFLGKPQGFSYQIASDGTVSFTKKKGKMNLFGHDTIIAVGKVDPSNMCNDGSPIPPNGQVTANLVVSLLPGVKISQDIELGDSCTQSSLIQGAQIFTYNRSFTNTVTISQSNASISFNMTNSMSYTDQNSCQDQTLP